MIARCGLTSLKQVSTPLAYHLRSSKTNPELLKALIQLDMVLYTGAELGPEEEAWAVQNGIKLRVNRISAVVFQLADDAFFLDLETIEFLWMHRNRRCLDLGWRERP